MGVYSRYKRGAEGFRALVELLESTPSSRRQKMLDVGKAEDPAFTEKALKYILNWDDIIQLSDMELAEVLAKAPPKVVSYALFGSSEETKLRFLKNCKPHIAAEIKDYFDVKIGPTEQSGAQMRIVVVTRELERAGVLRVKAIPQAI